MSARAEAREKFLNALIETGKTMVTKAEVLELAASVGVTNPTWFTNDSSNKIKRGLYAVPRTQQSVEIQAPAKSGDKIVSVTTELEETNLVPQVYKNYVPFGNFDDVASIVGSNTFFPVFVTGHSGNGKTMSIEQACAKLGRKFVCVSMTPETDESDLLGNYVLIDGQMEWRDGPVTVAARTGAVCCIDEVDYGAENLSCLQRVFEGKPFLLKKKGELVTPVSGFTLFATANTKGKGSDDGRYMFTNVLNEAFLERFPITIEQQWPPVAVEKKIIRKELESAGRADEDFAEKLVTWADVIRKTFEDGGCDEVISTRRLVHIVKTFGVFGDKMKAIGLCLNRFDDDTKASFLDLYTKVDAGASLEPAPEVQSVEENDPYEDDIPY